MAVRSSTLPFLRESGGRGERPDLIVVDPPRTGLGADIGALIAECASPALVYVSCDPATLARDLRALIAAGYSHRIHHSRRPVSADLPSGDSGPDATSLIGWRAIDTFQLAGAMESDSATPGPPAGAPAPTRLSTRRWSDLPLFHAAWLFAVGIVLAKLLWLRPSYLLLALVLIAALCGVAAVRAQRVSWMALAPLWILLGAWCAEMEPQPAPAPVLATLSDGLLRTVEGTVMDAGPVRGAIEEDLDQPSPSAPAQQPTQRLDVRVSTIENVTDSEDAQVPADGALRLTVRWPSVPDQPFRCGERVRALVRLLPPQVYRDPGAWNRQDYLLDLGITSTATLDSERVERLEAAPLQAAPTGGTCGRSRGNSIAA